MRSNLRSRKTVTESQSSNRIVIIDPKKCKPNSPAYAHLKRNSKACDKDCITVLPHTVEVSETACPACINRCKQCPGEAVSVVKLPTNFTTDTTHRYGPNSFKLHGLPLPRREHVLGLLGTNGTGKSSALSILSGRIKPNLGQLETPLPDWSDIVTYYRGSDLQNYFTGMLQDKVRVAMKPQLEPGLARRLRGRNVRDMLKARDERNKAEQVCRELELDHLLDREMQDLSGGELQRVVIACTVIKDADVYLFDEVSSFLDVKQRLKVTQIIRNLVHDPSEWPNGVLDSMKKYVIVVEHDLAILDFVSDYIQCLYGEPGAYGVVTSRSRVRNGINQFLAGYIKGENMRFRSHELNFKVTMSDFVVEDTADSNKSSTRSEHVVHKTGVLRYPDMTKVHVRQDEDGNEVSKFTLHVESGDFRDGEVVALLGENGVGKTTFMELLAGRLKSQRGSEPKKCSSSTDSDTGPGLEALGVSYKTQGLNPKLRKFRGTVQDLLEKEINQALANRLFRLLVMKPLGIDALANLPVATLSGGEMQRVSIVLCLGKPAYVYLIDEPSAGLDCEQRVVAAKVMKRWIVHHLGRTAFLVEHDFSMAAAMADRVIVYEGTPGVECTALPPTSVVDGFNRFLKTLNVTFRHDPVNYRPRINKRGSRRDKLQKASGEYYLFDTDGDCDDD